MRNFVRDRRSLVAIAAAIALLISGGAAFSLNGAAAHLPGPHPAHLHVGTCAEIGDIVFPLSDVGDDLLVDGTPLVVNEFLGAPSAIPVRSSATTVEATLADIIAGDHTLVVHESAEAIQNYIVCGDIGGKMMGALDLSVGLAELNNSGYIGTAYLHDNGDGTTTVRVFLNELVHEEEEGAEEAAATPDEAAAAPVASAVEIVDFAFNPQTIEVAVGDTVTWTNNDSTAHTVTQDPSGSGFQSDTLDPGATFEFTFDAAGEFPYFCEFHPNMTGTVVVS